MILTGKKLLRPTLYVMSLSLWVTACSSSRESTGAHSQHGTLSGGERFTYDELHRVSTFANANGEVVEYTYDALGRLEQIARPGTLGCDETGVGDCIAKFSYTAIGSLDWASAPSNKAEGVDAKITYDFDSLRRIKSRTEFGRSLSYTYSNNRIDSITYPSGRVVRRTYYPSGRLETISDGSHTITIEYDEATGKIAKMTRPGGIVTRYLYSDAEGVPDVMGRLRSIRHEQVDGTLVLESRYDLDPLGRATQLVRTTAGDSHVESYLYDAAGQLSQATINGEIHTFGYDEAGNRTTWTSPERTLNYIYEPGNLLVEVRNGANPIRTYRYNAVGNRLSDDNLETGLRRTYTYDHQNRLLSFTRVLNDLSIVTTYEYNAHGQRVAKVVNGEREEFAIDATSGLAQVVTQYLDEPDDFIYVGNQPIVAIRNGGSTVEVLLEDRLGSVVGIANGAALASPLSRSRTFRPFGDTDGSGGGVWNAYRFAGERLDPESGFVYLRARYYDPEVGRFLNKDPSGLRGGANLFAYAANDPVNRRDPSGLNPLNTVGEFLFNFRQQKNVDLPPTLIDMQQAMEGNTGWSPVPNAQAALHQDPNVAGLELKFVNADGREAVYYSGDGPLSGAMVTDPAIAGTFNGGVQAPIPDNKLDLVGWGKVLVTGVPHTVLDIVPYYLFEKGHMENLSEGLGTSTGSSLPPSSPVTPPPASSSLIDHTSPGDSSSLLGPGGNIFLDWGDGQFAPFEPGGVLFDEAAKYLGDIKALKGGRFDPTSGELIFVTEEAGSALEAIDPDYFAAALASVYGSAVPPHVSLDPSAMPYYSVVRAVTSVVQPPFDQNLGTAWFETITKDALEDTQEHFVSPEPQKSFPPINHVFNTTAPDGNTFQGRKSVTIPMLQQAIWGSEEFTIDVTLRVSENGTVYEPTSRFKTVPWGANVRGTVNGHDVTWHGPSPDEGLDFKVTVDGIVLGLFTGTEAMYFNGASITAYEIRAGETTLRRLKDSLLVDDLRIGVSDNGVMTINDQPMTRLVQVSSDHKGSGISLLSGTNVGGLVVRSSGQQATRWDLTFGNFSGTTSFDPPVPARTYEIHDATVVPSRQQRRFGGRIEDSSAGWVMYEADRVMKCLAIGKCRDGGHDSLPTSDYTSATLPTVPGFQNLIERGVTSGDVRMWFAVNDMALKRDVDEQGRISVVWDSSTVRLLTQSLLFDGVQDHVPQAVIDFAEHLSTNYDAFAEQSFLVSDPANPGQTKSVKIFDELRKVAQAISLARFFRDNKIPLDLWWLNDYSPSVVPSLRSIETASNASADGALVIHGGADFCLNINPIEDSAEAQQISTAIDISRTVAVESGGSDVVGSDIDVAEFTCGDSKCLAALPEGRQQIGNRDLTRTDLSFVSPGSRLEFVRAYHSADRENRFAMGTGWSPGVLRLEFERPTLVDETGRMYNETTGLPVWRDTANADDSHIHLGKHRVVDLASGTGVSFTSSAAVVEECSDGNIFVSGLDENDLPSFAHRNRATLSQLPLGRGFEFQTPNGTVHTFDASGRHTRTLDAVGNRRDMTYDELGRLSTIADAVGQKITLRYDATSGLLSEVEGPGEPGVESNEKVTYVVSSSLDQAVFVRSQTSETYEYDSATRMTRATGIDGTAFVEDNVQCTDLRNRSCSSHVNGLARSMTYDRDNTSQGAYTATKTTSPVGMDPCQFTSRVNAYGQRETFGDCNGAVHELAWSSTSAMRPSGYLSPVEGVSSVAINWTPEGLFASATNPNNIRATCDESVEWVDTAADNPEATYLGRPWATVAADCSRTEFRYNMETKELSGVVLDALGLAETISISHDRSGEGDIVTIIGQAATRVMEYDKFGRLVAQTDAGVSIRYGYDVRGRVETVTKPGVSSPIRYAYNALDQVELITYPDDTTTAYQYDPVTHRPIQVTDRMGRIKKFDHDSNGRVSSETLVGAGPQATDLVTRYHYNAFGDLQLVALPGGSSLEYQTDHMGRLTGVETNQCEDDTVAVPGGLCEPLPTASVQPAADTSVSGE